MGKKSRVVIAEQVGESARNVQRYIRLTELIPELLDMVDAKKLNFTIAVDISYIDKENAENGSTSISEIQDLLNQSRLQL